MMAIYGHISAFGGKPVETWIPSKTSFKPNTNYRILLDYEQAEEGITWKQQFLDLIEQPEIKTLEGLVVGHWRDWTAAEEVETADSVRDEIVAAREKLPNLRHIFFGDIVMEESEISWIETTDLTPLLEAYPQLETFMCRGGNGLKLGPVTHNHLKKLVIQSGGLDRKVVQDVIMSTLPALEHLEFYLGAENYGATSEVDDFTPLLRGDRFPKLQYLGLRDSEIADDLAAVVANSPVLDTIEILDMSLGTLGDDGAHALLKSDRIKKLKKLDLHHHFISKEVMEELRKLPVEVELSDAKEEERWNDRVWRFVAVSE
jgi:hypothetical protein